MSCARRTAPTITSFMYRPSAPSSSMSCFQFRLVDALMDTFENEFCDDRILRQFFLGLGDEIAVEVDKFKFIDSLYEKVNSSWGMISPEGAAVTVVYGVLPFARGRRLLPVPQASHVDIGLVGIV